LKLSFPFEFRKRRERKMKFQAIAIHDKDNVGVLLADVRKNERVPIGGQQSLVVVALEDIRFGHKIALVNIPPGGIIQKYGHPIGVATQKISAGEHVHIHNVGGLRAGGKSPAGKGGRA
jgi:altronate dehydratase small subunit